MTRFPFALTLALLLPAAAVAQSAQGSAPRPPRPVEPPRPAPRATAAAPAALPLAPSAPLMPLAPLAPLTLEPMLELESALTIASALELDAVREHARTFALERDAARLALDAVRASVPSTVREQFATRPPAAWAADDPADSVYREARELLNRGEYRRAALAFRDIGQKYPKSEYAADALYWEAFARYRIGATEELREALRALELQRTRYPQAKTQTENLTLATRIRGALATRGDASAARALERDATANGAACDREDQTVRVEALSALEQSDPASVMPLLRRVLARRDECSGELRRRAVFILGRKADSSAATLLGEVVRGDPRADVRADAVLWLARVPGDQSLAMLEDILRTASDEQVQRAAIRALGDQGSPRARQVVRQTIERTDASDALRAEAIRSFERERATTVVKTAVGGTAPRTERAAPSTEEAAYLRALYPRLDRRSLKLQVLTTVGRLGGAENEEWLGGIARSGDEALDLRAHAVSMLGNARALSTAELTKLYDAVNERSLRERLISVYGARKEPEATDKLIEIVRTGTDPQLRRQAISALTRKNDPRTAKLLLEIIDK